MIHKWLVLGGTKDARDFINQWRGDRQVTLVESLAGVTSDVADSGVMRRVGGFSEVAEDGTKIDGATGMARYIDAQACHAVIDITHPFAARISANARAAATQANVPYVQFLRAPWQPLPDDHWHYHDSWEALFQNVKTRHLFLAGGHEALAALPMDCRMPITARMIEPPKIALSELPDTIDIMLGRPAAHAQEEEALFRKKKITAVAAKLSGGKAGAGKLAAARALGLDVHLVKRPDYPDGWFDNMAHLHRHLRIMLSKANSLYSKRD